MTPERSVREVVPLAAPPDAVVSVPGSKSLTNRALVLAALADGPSRLTNALFCDDTVVMVESLWRLGFDVRVDERALTMDVIGLGGVIPARAADLFVGGAGTAARFLTAMACLGAGRYHIDGVDRMRERPIQDLVDALAMLGASVEATRGALPVVVEASGLRGGRTVVRGEVSSQFVSAILMAAPYAAGDVEVVVEGRLVGAPYVEMTLATMAAFGVDVTREGVRRFWIRAGQRYRPREYAVEPDASGAAYFFAAAAITGGRVTVPGLGTASLQGDVGFVDVLEQMGCAVDRRADAVTVRGTADLRGVDVDLGGMSDQTMTLAAVAPFARGPTRIRGVAHIRHQESDRLAATAAELRRLGQDVEELEDGLRITPRPIRPAVVQTYGDHRLAMAFAVAGLRAPGIAIADPACVAKTFPDFFERLDRLRRPTG
ncbi:MAG: 3-phosphoshikimate 1-carboxyvinyltransferase [Armatimonadota bacterium]|nr:3-phosphoshikimate 1-carboxyvinyltransferase [Armatimonadota bacterium]MDR7549781.1 3-phosphoshikimate 1-carboxyvinyltransferase [Armatimonadota bacterium]